MPKHSIHILLTHPRATATAFEKIMINVENMKVLHAPFNDTHLGLKYTNEQSAFNVEKNKVKKSFDDIMKDIIQMSKQQPVFFKESAHLLNSWLKKNTWIFKNPKVKIAFLVRDPAKSILSFYKKMPNFDISIVGHLQLLETYNLAKEHMAHKELMVIDSDLLLKNPLPILNKLACDWSLPEFTQESLAWQTGYSEDWTHQNWYDVVASSEGLLQHSGEIERERGVPLYYEVEEPDRTRLRTMFQVLDSPYQVLLSLAYKAKIIK